MLARMVATLLLIQTVCLSGTISFEGDTYPETAGWDRRQTVFTAPRSLMDGWFVQEPRVIQTDPIGYGEEDYYSRSLAQFTGSGTFSVEWRVQTDGHRTEIPAVAPAVLAVADLMGNLYHFTIAADQARFIDPDLSVYLVDIAPAVPHTYRLELYETESFRWFIDGTAVVSGVPDEPFPGETAEIVFGAAEVLEHSVTRWDYIRVVPEPAAGLLLLCGCAGLLRRR